MINELRDASFNKTLSYKFLKLRAADYKFNLELQFSKKFAVLNYDTASCENFLTSWIFKLHVIKTFGRYGKLNCDNWLILVPRSFVLK